MKNTMKAIAVMMLMTAVIIVNGCTPEDDPNSGGGDSKIPEGALKGVFTVDRDGHQIYFSKGNLWYYNASETPYWKFADHQWDCNTNDAICYFAWGTSGYNHGANLYLPDSYSQTSDDFFAYGDKNAALGDYSGKADWGYNAIVNGGNQEGLWRSPHALEFSYIMYHRESVSGVRFVRAKVNDLDGCILFPDDWDASKYTINNPNMSEGYSSDNVIPLDDWVTILEPAGCVLLITAGWANSTGTGEIFHVGRQAGYWCSNISSNGNPSSFYIAYYNMGTNPQVRFSHYAVRLVRDVK